MQVFLFHLLGQFQVEKWIAGLCLTQDRGKPLGSETDRRMHHGVDIPNSSHRRRRLLVLESININRAPIRIIYSSHSLFSASVPLSLQGGGLEVRSCSAELRACSFSGRLFAIKHGSPAPYANKSTALRNCFPLPPGEGEVRRSRTRVRRSMLALADRSPSPRPPPGGVLRIYAKVFEARGKRILEWYSFFPLPLPIHGERGARFTVRERGSHHAPTPNDRPRPADCTSSSSGGRPNASRGAGTLGAGR